MKASARLLPLFSMVSIALAAAPAAAQPGANWTESGYVTILVHNEIVIGLTRTVSNSQPGSLLISNVGAQDFPRDLGEIDLDFGQLEVTSAFADSLTSMSVGTTSDTETRDPSVGTLVVRLSDFRVPVVLNNGTVTCEVSTMSLGSTV